MRRLRRLCAHLRILPTGSWPSPGPPHCQVDDDVKYGMIDAISHLIHRDYERIVEVGGVTPTPHLLHLLCCAVPHGMSWRSPGRLRSRLTALLL